MVVSAPELRFVPTQVGELAVLGGRFGVRRVCFPGQDPAATLSGLRLQSAEGPLDPSEVAEEGAAQIARYFSGELREFTVPVDLGAVDGFQRLVLEAAAGIPFGETASYREMAIAAGSPEAVRAAGSAMGANPVPILVPCHRVIRSDGNPGLYGGGEGLKRWLLAFETAVGGEGT